MPGIRSVTPGRGDCQFTLLRPVTLSNWEHLPSLYLKLNKTAVFSSFLPFLPTIHNFLLCTSLEALRTSSLTPHFVFISLNTRSLLLSGYPVSCQSSIPIFLFILLPNLTPIFPHAPSQTLLLCSLEPLLCGQPLTPHSQPPQIFPSPLLTLNSRLLIS